MVYICEAESVSWTLIGANLSLEVRYDIGQLTLA